MHCLLFPILPICLYYMCWSTPCTLKIFHFIWRTVCVLNGVFQPVSNVLSSNASHLFRPIMLSRRIIPPLSKAQARSATEASNVFSLLRRLSAAGQNGQWRPTGWFAPRSHSIQQFCPLLCKFWTLSRYCHSGRESKSRRSEPAHLVSIYDELLCRCAG